MPPSKGKESRGKNENIKQEDILQAVVVADSFNNRFEPLTTEKPKSLFPLVNTPIIEYTLEFLSSAGVKQVFLYACKHVDQMKSYIENSRWGKPGCHMVVTILVFEDAHSFGDVLRNLDAQGLIRSDFILLSGDLVANLKLQCFIDDFRNKKKDDKGTLMSLVYRRALPGHSARCAEDETILGVSSKTKRILRHEKVYGHRKVSIPLEIFEENECVDIHYDLLDTHISICSPQVPTLFTDNFDYQTRDDFIRGILENEDILGNTIYLELCNEGYAAPVHNFAMYNSVSCDLIHRWAFPFAPECSNGKQRYSASRRNQYRHKNVSVGQNTHIGVDVVIGEGCKIGKDCQIKGSVIGDHCIIEDNVTIFNSYLWNKVQVKKHCSIKAALLCCDVVLEEGCDIVEGCVVATGVKLASSVKLSARDRIVNSSYDKRGKQLGKDTYLYNKVNDSESEYDSDIDGLVNGNESFSESSGDDDEHDTDVSVSGSPPPDDLKLFYNEVLDSLTRGLEEKVSCENLILEVNSSKYAYNVTMKELNVQIMRATLDQHCLDNLLAGAYYSQLKEILTHLVPLYKNYYRSCDSQVDCLQALQESCNSSNNLVSVIVKVLDYLYEEDVISEEAVLLWYHQHVSNVVKPKVTPFIKWLEEAEEESE